MAIVEELSRKRVSKQPHEQKLTPPSMRVKANQVDR